MYYRKMISQSINQSINQFLCTQLVVVVVLMRSFCRPFRCFLSKELALEI